METAVILIHDAAPILGERALVLGQGVVGLLVASLLREFPLGALVTSDYYPLRRNASLNIGVDDSFDPKLLIKPNNSSVTGLMITSGPDAGRIAFRIDDRPEQALSTVTRWSQSLHLPWGLMLADDLPHGKHTVRVRLVDGALRVFHLLEN